jgi:hypothetical protein
MRALALLLCLLFSLPVWAATGSAAADTWYIRPSGTCPNNGDGLAYNCAASGGASGAFSGFNSLIKTVTVGIDDGDTVRVCGDFVQADAETQFTNQAMFAVEEDATAGSPITITSDCSAAGGGTTTTLTSDRTSGSLIRTYANTNITFAGTWVLSGAKDAGITLYNNSATDATATKNIRIGSGITIKDIHTGALAQGIASSGKNVTIGDYSTTGRKMHIYDIGVDGIFFYSAGSAFVDGVTMDHISVDDANGDCVQIQRVTDGTVVNDLDCDKTNRDSKQCAIVTCSNAGNATCATGADFTQTVYVKRMQCLMAGGSLSIGAYGEGQFHVESSYISNPGTYGITGSLDTGSKLFASGNVVVGAITGCIDVHKTAFGPDADIYNNTLVNCGTYGINAAASTLTINIRNNSITGTSAYGIYRGASGTSDSYNNVFGPTTPYSDNGVAGAAGTGDKAADPLFTGTSASSYSYRLSAGSTLRRAGLELNLGNLQDNGNRAFAHPPSMGAWEAASGNQAAARTARTTATAR